MPPRSDGPREKEAALWAARLIDGAPPLTEEQRGALAEWQTGAEGNAASLDRHLDLWDDPAFVEAARSRAPTMRRSRRKLLGGAGAALVAGGVLWLGQPSLRRALADAATAPGELRTLPPLEGGGRLTLDTASAVDLDGGGAHLLAGALRLDLPAGGRSLHLRAGQASLQAAPGTVLTLRRTPGADLLAVLQGGATIPGGTLGAKQGLVWGVDGPRPPHPLSLAEIDAAEGFAEAWRLFEETTLGEVVEELARYVPGRILVSAEAARMRVSGRFRFAQPEAVLAVLLRTMPLRATRYGTLLTRLDTA